MTVYPHYQPFSAKCYGDNPPPLIHAFELTMSGIKPIGSFRLVKRKAEAPSYTPEDLPATKRIETAAAEVISPARKEASSSMLRLGTGTTKDIAKRAVSAVIKQLPAMAPHENGMVAELILKASNPQNLLSKDLEAVKADPSQFDAVVAKLINCLKVSPKTMGILNLPR